MTWENQLEELKSVLSLHSTEVEKKFAEMTRLIEVAQKTIDEEIRPNANKLDESEKSKSLGLAKEIAERLQKVVDESMSLKGHAKRYVASIKSL